MFRSKTIAFCDFTSFGNTSSLKNKRLNDFYEDLSAEKILFITTSSVVCFITTSSVVCFITTSSVVCFITTSSVVCFITTSG
jgi:hypothetical protein